MPGDGYGITRACGTSIAFPRLDSAESEQDKIIFMCEMDVFGSRSLVIFLGVPDGMQRGYYYSYDNQSWNYCMPASAAFKDWFFHAGRCTGLTVVSIEVIPACLLGLLGRSRLIPA